MTETISPLYLLHTRPDQRRLAAWGIRHGLMQHQGDLGYVLHALLHAVFGNLAPQPFHYVDSDQGLLAYLQATPDAIARCVALVDPDAAAALGLVASADSSGYSLRQFPAQWPAGHMLAFDVRVRPVVRSKRGERDAFLCAVEAAGDPASRPPLDRAEVYARWLQLQLAVRADGNAEPWQGAVELLDMQMTRYQRLEVMRKKQPVDEGCIRQQHIIAGPDVELSGHLRVVDSAGFAVLLARGIGRHRAFGFGMLRLRRSDR